MFREIGFPELLVIMAIVLLLFGVGRVSRIGKELGSAIGAFRKGLNESKEAEQLPENDKSGEG